MTVFSAYGWSIYVLRILWKDNHFNFFFFFFGDAAELFGRINHVNKDIRKVYEKRKILVHHKSFMKKETLDQTTNWKWGMDSDLERRHRSGRPLTFPLCLLIIGAAVCVYYMYLSHIVYQIFISVSFKLNIFQTSLVTTLWITLKHFSTFIVVWECWFLCWCSCQ